MNEPKNMKEWEARMRSLDSNEDEIKKCVSDPLYYYNNYQRLPGHKIMTQEEFDANVSKHKEENDEGGMKALQKHRAERTFENRPDILEHTYDLWQEEKKKAKAEKKRNKFSNKLMEKFRKGKNKK